MNPSKDDSVFPTAAGSGVANTSFAGQWAKSRTSSSQESGAAFVDAAPEAQANAELGAPPAKIAVTSAAVTVTSDKCDVSIALFQQMQEKIAALERQLCSSMPRNESEVKCFVSAPTAIAAMPSPSQPTAIGVSTQPSVGLNCASAVGNDRAHALPTVCQPQWPTSANSNWISPPMQTNSATASNWTSPRHLLDLPYFDGNAEQWPLFATMYVQSSAMYNYTNFENCLRLQRALKGEARETVKSLLIHPDNVSAVMDQLQCRFGRTEQLIRSQLDQVRQVQPITESGLEKLIPFATKAKNLVVFLESANASHHIANPTLLDELIAKLPMNKRIEWAKYAAPIKPYPTLVDFSQWLDDIANCICAVQQCVSQPHSDSRRRQVLYVNEKKDVCPICGGDHKAPVCQKFAAANVNTRWEECKRLRMCFGCLTPGHSLRNCRRQARCPVTDCYRKHHKLLHAAESRRGASQSCASDRGNAEETVLSCRTPASGNGLLFRVLPVTLYGPKGKKNVYALMDEGSSITIMDNSLIEQLGLPSRQRNLNIQWFGGRSTCEPVQVVNIHVSGASMEKKHMLRNVYGVNDLQLPVQSLHESDLRRISDECPLRPYDNVKPQVLIGLDHCHLGLPTEMITTQKSGPFAAKTELGWVVFGPTLHSVASPSCLLIRSKEDQHLHDLVTDYFSTESFGVKAAPIVESCDDIRARKLLEATTERVGGRFQTGLLWKTDDVLLPDSYPMALKRLIGIERKMKGDVEFAANYSSIISSYVNKGYARKLQPAEAAAVGPTTWYLPHFAVRNPNKPGKLRLVFDAAAAVDGISLNTHSEGTWTFLPSNSIHDASVASEELRLKTVLLVESNRFIEFNRFSSYTRLERTVAWMLRFCNACRQRLEPLQLYGLSAMELHSAEIVLCRQAQAEAYGAEIAQIQCDGRVSKESTLITLLPYLDDDRLLRVYGRIDAASCLPYSTKRPIILPPNHLLTELIVLHHHSRMMHQNHEAAICETRRQLWNPPPSCFEVSRFRCCGESERFTGWGVLRIASL